jgi:hypothetical protein
MTGNDSFLLLNSVPLTRRKYKLSNLVDRLYAFSIKTKHLVRLGRQGSPEVYTEHRCDRCWTHIHNNSGPSRNNGSLTEEPQQILQREDRESIPRKFKKNDVEREGMERRANYKIIGVVYKPKIRKVPGSIPTIVTSSNNISW